MSSATHYTRHDETVETGAQPNPFTLREVVEDDDTARLRRQGES